MYIYNYKRFTISWLWQLTDNLFWTVRLLKNLAVKTPHFPRITSTLYLKIPIAVIWIHTIALGI